MQIPKNSNARKRVPMQPNISLASDHKCDIDSYVKNKQSCEEDIGNSSDTTSDLEKSFDSQETISEELTETEIIPVRSKSKSEKLILTSINDMGIEIRMGMNVCRYSLLLNILVRNSPIIWYGNRMMEALPLRACQTLKVCIRLFRRMFGYAVDSTDCNVQIRNITCRMHTVFIFITVMSTHNVSSICRSN